MKIFTSGAFVALWLLMAGVASAQDTTGALTGRLEDSQGLALPGVTVTATGQQGAKTAVTDADGSYRIPFLTPGSYVVKAELQGFKTAERRAVTVSLGQVTTVNVQLEVGGLTEVVTVTGSTAVAGHELHDDRRGAERRSAVARAGGPPLHRRALPGARRQQQRVGRNGQSVDVRIDAASTTSTSLTA